MLEGGGLQQEAGAHLTVGCCTIAAVVLKAVLRGVPMVSARYCLCTHWSLNCLCITATTSGTFAKSTTPLVFMSNLCSG